MYATGLGAQYAGDSKWFLDRLPDSSVDLVLTSPPFALLRAKPYGNESQDAYVAWLSGFGESIKRVLKDSGSLVLDLGGAYQRGVPVRSLYNYRILIEFCDTLGFHLAEEFFWHNPSRLPSPVEWVNKRKIRVKDAVNTVWWLSKSPRPKADARNVRVPYSPRMVELLRDPDRYYTPKSRPSEHRIAGSFAADNGGALPSNLLSIANTDSSGSYLRLCRLLEQKPHPARFPAGLPRFFVRFLTDPGDVVVDIFSGSNTTGWVAEQEGRRWLSFELAREYARLSIVRFLPGRTDDEVRRIWNTVQASPVRID